MGRSKKQKTEVERLQDEIKELKSINKSLSRKIKEDNKKYKPENDKDKLLKEDFDEKNTCKNCGKGNITIIELGPKKIRTCSLKCGYREIIKDNAKEKKEEV